MAVNVRVQNSKHAKPLSKDFRIQQLSFLEYDTGFTFYKENERVNILRLFFLFKKKRSYAVWCNYAQVP